LRAFSITLLAAGFIACGVPVSAQTIRIYSEFERFDPFGNPVAADRDLFPREILSPAVTRNGHISVHVVVSGPANTNYLLYAASNPPGIVKLDLYREYFVPCGSGYCPDWIVPQRIPSFGAIPETLSAMPGQSTRCYLLDIYVPPDIPPRHIRIEALLKVGTWIVAPMELRVMAPLVPQRGPNEIVQSDVAALDAPSSGTAQRQLQRYLAGLPPEFPPAIVSVRDIAQRNAAEDMLLARAQSSRTFPELQFFSAAPAIWPFAGAEWYLRVRDFLYNLRP